VDLAGVTPIVLDITDPASVAAAARAASIAGDITCDAPGARIRGAQQYRDFLGRFMVQLTGAQTAAAFGDDTTALLFYYPHTANTSDAPTAECSTVTGGKITRSVLVFDRPSFAPPQP